VSLFGPRDEKYVVVGIEYHNGNPQLYYPTSNHHVVVRLARRCESDCLEALYELAHECIHLLSPTGGMDVTVLEEGLAVYFAELHLREEHGVPKYPTTQATYTEARQAVQRLLSIDASVIRALRQRQPALSRVTAQDLLACNRAVPRDLAERLCEPFTY
jgi:hypothetical protein